VTNPSASIYRKLKERHSTNGVAASTEGKVQHRRVVADPPNLANGTSTSHHLGFDPCRYLIFQDHAETPPDPQMQDVISRMLKRNGPVRKVKADPILPQDDFPSDGVGLLAGRSLSASFAKLSAFSARMS